MNQITRSVSRLLHRRFGATQRGVTIAEYGLMVFLISVVITGSVVLFGHNISGLFTRVTDQVKGAPPAPGTGQCVEGSNENHYFDNKFWTYKVNYDDPDNNNGTRVGTMTYDGDNPTGLWLDGGNLQPPPVHDTLYAWSERGAFLSVGASRAGYLYGMGVTAPVGDNGTTLYNYTEFNYERGTAFVFDFQVGGNQPTQADAEAIVPNNPGEWHGDAWIQPSPTSYPPAFGVASAPYDVSWAPTADDPVFGGARGVAKTTPPDGIDSQYLTCPAVDNGGDNGGGNGGQVCTPDDTSNWFWVKDVKYYAADGTFIGTMETDGNGEHWYGEVKNSNPSYAERGALTIREGNSSSSYPYDFVPVYDKDGARVWSVHVWRFDYEGGFTYAVVDGSGNPVTDYPGGLFLNGMGEWNSASVWWFGEGLNYKASDGTPGEVTWSGSPENYQGPVWMGGVQMATAPAGADLSQYQTCTGGDGGGGGVIG